MQCKSLWIKASAKCINVNVKSYYMTSEDLECSQELLLLISSMQKRHDHIYSLCIRSDAFSELMESEM